jgi:hypothetical protein
MILYCISLSTENYISIVYFIQCAKLVGRHSNPIYYYLGGAVKKVVKAQRNALYGTQPKFMSSPKSHKAKLTREAHFLAAL